MRVIAVRSVHLTDSLHQKAHPVAVHVRVAPVLAVMLGDMPLAHQEERLDEERALHANAESGHESHPNNEREETHNNLG